MKGSFKRNGTRTVIFALIFGVFAVAAWQTVSAKENPNENFLSSVFGSISNLFVENKIENSNSLTIVSADDPVIGVCDTAGPVEVESTGGTMTPTAYPTLKGAFDAINAGTHTGSINIEICGNTTETASASLEASGTGSASYTGVTIRPVGGGRTIEGTITGAIIKLNGADNVTIDGRQGGTGTARDLTVRNNSTATATAAIWLASVVAGNGASNNVIRNLEIAAGQTANTGTNVTIGLLMGGTTISLTATTGNDNDNNQFIFNRVTRARYGIATRSVTTNNSEGLVITDNLVGPTSFGADEIGKAGIYLQADAGAIVSRNTVQFVGGDLANTTAGTDRCGICVGNENWGVTESATITSGEYTVTKNIVHDIVEERTFSAVGIRMGTTRGAGNPTNNLVANNFIYNVRGNGTTGDQVAGIGYVSGHTDRVVNNSISLTGDMDPGAAAASLTFGNAIRISQANGTTHANLTMMNNSIYLDASSSSTAALRFYAITINSAAYSFGTGGLNYNNYYINPANTQLQTGGLGTNTGNSITTQFATLANWQGALTTPQDANSIQADPQHFSTTSDLHIQTSSPNIDTGTTIAGITDDIDAQTRPNGANFDIGADEFYPSPGSVQLSTSSYTVSESAGMVTVTVTRSGGSNGAASVDYATGGGTATGGGSCGAGVDYVSTSGTLMWADLDAAPKMFNVPICADGVLEAVETFNVTLSNVMTATLGTPSMATVSINDAGSTFNGAVNVGTGETLTSLTNPGGVFDAINNGIVTGNITVNITSDLTGESGSVPLNEVAGGFTVLIKPDGEARSITSTGSAISVIKLNDADNVTIDGSLSGGTDRSLSITNTNPAANTTVIWLGNTTNGAQNNTVKNLNLAGGFDQSTGSVFNFGIISSTSASILTGGADNDNNTFTNNFIRKVSVGIISIGGLAANPNQNTTISNNLIGPAAFGSDQISTLGMLLFNENAPSVVDNEIRFIGEAANSGGSSGRDHVGISLCTGSASWSGSTAPAAVGTITNANVSRNLIHDIVERATFSSAGIVNNCPNTAPTNNVIANNMIYNILANGTAGDQAVGIGISNGNGDTVAFNSIYLTGDVDPTGATASSTSSFGINVGFATALNLTLKNNVSVMDLNSNTGTLLHAALNLQSAAFNFGTGGSDFNDLYPNPANTQARVAATGGSGGTFYATLPAYQTAVMPQDANSKSVDPMFVSGTDLHIQMGSPVIGMATPLASVTDDFDSQMRDGMPDMGADEFVVLMPGSLQFDMAAYSIGEGGGMATLTVTRTGGSDGAVTVDYSLGGGTATGGASCGGAVDYVNTGGTVMFANGETSKTFDVAICDDAVFEGNETFDATLSNATGGATIGSPSMATVTITDNKGQPTVQFGSATYTTAETLGSNGIPPGATINVTLSGASQSAVMVDYATSNGSATGGATCTAGVDYINASGTLTFNPGETNKSFFVTTCPDMDAEGDETVNLALTNPVGATLGTPNMAVLTITDNDSAACSTASPIEVESTGGTTTPTGYPTLKGAFDAINAGTHTGSINVKVCGDTTETATASLDASGVGSTSYTDVTVRPVGSARTIEGTLSGTSTGAIVKLNGADNVTIDGRQGGMGTARDLTIQNNSNATGAAAVWLSSLAAGSGATDNVIRNLNLACGVSNANALTTVGIIMSGTLISTTSNGNDNDNNQFIFNRITSARYGIVTRGVTTNNNIAPIVTDNIIGPDSGFGADGISKTGILMQADTNAVVSRNTIQYIGGDLANTTAGADRIGIGIGSEAWSATTTTTLTSGDYTVTKNVIHDVVEERTFSSVGILLATTRGGSATNNLVANNFIYNNRANGTVGDQVVGIGVAGGNTDRIVHNSISLTGDMDPGAAAASATYGNAIRINAVNGTNNANFTVANNSIYLDASSSSTAGLHYYAITLSGAAYSFGTGFLNYNNYYINPANTQLQTGGLGVNTGNTITTEFATLANWQGALTTPQDANSIQSNPLYFSNTVDPHIQQTSPNIDAATPIAGITDDIDSQVRPNGANPDIGADEFYPSAGTIQLSSSSYNVSETAGTVTITVYRLAGANGTASVDYATGGGTATAGASCSAGVDYISTSGTLMWADMDAAPKTFNVQICPDGEIEPTETFGVNLSNPVGAMLGTPSSATVSIINTGSTVNGTINVGTGETITSLTNPGGIFDVINNGMVTGNITINITSDLTSETGAIALNEIPGGFTVLIRPSGEPRTISGISAASSGLIILNGADNVTIDGSLSLPPLGNGNDRSLTITNNQATTGIVIWMRSPNASNGANNNTVKNSIINGAPGPNSTTVAGILTGSSVTLGGDAEAANSNNTIHNNWIYRVQNSLYLRGGATAPVFDQNWVVTDNELGSTVTNDNNIFRGMLIGNAQNFTITGNTVHGIRSTTTTTAAMSGIQIGLLVNTGLVANNDISNIKNVSATGTGAAGISVIATSTASNVTIANNFVSDVAANGSATITSNGFGISFNSTTGGSGYNIYHNSVNLNTNQTTAQTSAAMFVNSTFSTAGALNVRNNIFANTQTTGTRYAFYSAAAASVYTAINYNDYFAQNVGFIGGSARPTLSDWQTGTGQDANSKAVDPLFVSSTDLHIQAGSPMADMGVSGTGITTDIDGDARDAMPDIGADEIAQAPAPGTLQFSNETYSGSEGGSPFTVTVTRASGSAGTVTVDYATSNGTATGGAACTAGVDYINTSGTLTFLDGVMSQTFDVTICDDATDEPDETINYTLSNPMGGATLGTPSTAVQTIVDNDGPATMFTFSISDAKVVEGNSGMVNAVFTVTLANIPTGNIGGTIASVQYSTANGTATAGSDYTATSGTLNFSSTGTMTVSVPVNGDTVKESNEFFFVNLSNPSMNAIITDGQGAGIIVDEDRPYVADYDRDLMADFSVYRSTNTTFYVSKSSKGFPIFQTLGATGDISVPGDYDGDGKTDFALFRPSTGDWTILRSSDNTTTVVNWGLGTDKPVPGDYDGDGKADFAVYRPSEGNWYILPSGSGVFYAVNFGISTDRLVQADYDGDFKTDVAVYRDGTWYALRSSDGSVLIQNWGLAGDKPAVGDFDSDGRNDLTVYRNGDWYIFRSLTNDFVGLSWGIAGDIPVPADYDGDGTSDVAVFRPSAGDWYVIKSTGGTIGFHWGQNGDVPTPAAYLPQ